MKDDVVVDDLDLLGADRYARGCACEEATADRGDRDAGNSECGCC
jgi:hypothetical protein